MPEPNDVRDPLSDSLADDVKERQTKARFLITRPVMSEDAARFYTALFAILTVIGVYVGGGIAFVEYLEKKNNDESSIILQRINAKIETSKPFFTKELDYCLAISTKAAAVANADTTKKQAALAEFEELTEGPLTILEDETVARRAADFDDCSKNNNCKKDLVALAVNLGHSCRLLMAKNFKLSLDALPDLDPDKATSPTEQIAERIVTFAVSGSFPQGDALASTSKVSIDRETGLVVSANIQIANTGEVFSGAPVYNTDRMWQWQNQGSLGGSLDFQDQQRTFRNYSGGTYLTNSAYWTPSLGHIVTSSDTSFTPYRRPQPNR